MIALAVGLSYKRQERNILRSRLPLPTVPVNGHYRACLPEAAFATLPLQTIVLSVCSQLLHLQTKLRRKRQSHHSYCIWRFLPQHPVIFLFKPHSLPQAAPRGICSDLSSPESNPFPPLGLWRDSNWDAKFISRAGHLDVVIEGTGPPCSTVMKVRRSSPL